MHCLLDSKVKIVTWTYIWYLGGNVQDNFQWEDPSGYGPCGMGSANKQRCYNVTPSLVGQAHTQNDRSSEGMMEKIHFNSLRHSDAYMHQ